MWGNWLTPRPFTLSGRSGACSHRTKECLRQLGALCCGVRSDTRLHVGLTLMRSAAQGKGVCYYLKKGRAYRDATRATRRKQQNDRRYSAAHNSTAGSSFLLDQGKIDWPVTRHDETRQHTGCDSVCITHVPVPVQIHVHVCLLHPNADKHGLNPAQFSSGKCWVDSKFPTPSLPPSPAANFSGIPPTWASLSALSPNVATQPEAGHSTLSLASVI